MFVLSGINIVNPIFAARSSVPNPGIYTQKTNKYHKSVNFILGEKQMLKFKQTEKKVAGVNIVVVLDRSSSMRSIREEAINSLNTQLRKYKEESDRTGIKTLISIITFSDTIDYNDAILSTILSMDIKDTTDIDADSYVPNGSTGLYDAIAYSTGRLRKDFSNLLIVITDGQENCSITHNLSSTKRLISELDQNTTLAFCMPPGCKKYAEVLGVPAGCITEWEANRVGVEKLTSSICRSTSTLYDGYTRGIRGSSSFFSPDLNNLSPAVVNTNLDDLTNQFLSFSVPRKEMISSFITTKTRKPYVIGSAFYQLTKKEKVQDFKDVLLRDKNTGAIYGGDNARSLLRIPSGGEIKLNPSDSPNYEVYVRSASWNRNLMPNTNVLVKKN